MLNKISIISLLAIMTLIPNLACADGMMIEPYPDRWDYADETFQKAFINYEKGIEKMILSVGTEISEGAVWILPLPASPQDTVVSVVTQMPNLRGQEITKSAANKLDDITESLAATQLYTIPIISLLLKSRSIKYDDAWGLTNVGSTSQREKDNYDVEVHEHFEKEGITSEIITAGKAEGLYQYLKDFNLDIDQGAIPVLDSYIGKNYTFVVSWITPPIDVLNSENEFLMDEEGNLISPSSDEDEFQDSIYEPDIFMPKSQSVHKGIFVAFPTDKIYYPLLPTSVYESAIVPTDIRIFGFVDPEIYSSLETWTDVEYYFQNNLSLDKELEILYRGPFEDVKYTKIEIQAPSKMLKDDLWVENQMPLKTYLPYNIFRHPVIFWLFLLIKISILTAIIVGLAVYSEARKSFRAFLKVILMGLFNCLTLAGLILAALNIRIKEHKAEARDIISQLKQKSYIWKRRLAHTLLIIDIPFLVISIIVLGNIIDELLRYYRNDYWYFDLGIIYAIIFLIILPVAVLVFALIIKRIKKPDKDLFEKLKKLDYSTWTFTPKDNRKYIFMTVFSAVFIILSLLAKPIIQLFF